MGRVIDIRSRRVKPQETQVGISMSSEPNRVSFTHGSSDEVWEMPADHAVRFARRLMAAARAARRMAGLEAELAIVAERRSQIRLVTKKPRRRK